MMPLFSIGQESKDNAQLFFEEPYPLKHSEINSVTCIFKDSRHIMWIGTENGLYRYDGVNVRYFGHKTGDTNSLPDNNVLSIAEGKDGELWVAMLSGMAEIDLYTLHFKTYTGENNRLEAKNFTNRICIDDLGNVWLGNNLGIFLFDKKKQIFKNVWYDKIAGYNLSPYVTSVVSVNRHLLIASTFHDLIFFNKDDHSFKRVPVIISPPPKDTSITTIFLDSKQKLWIGTWNGGIYVYDLAKKELLHINSLQHIYDMPNFYVTSFYETNIRNRRILWISTAIGLLKCNVGNNSNIDNFIFIKHEPDQENGIIYGKLESLYLDSDGALWCGGYKGICKCFPFQNNFNYVASLEGSILGVQPLKINSRTYNFIYSWHAHSGKGFILIDSNGKEAPYKIDPQFKDMDDGKNISGIVKDKYNRYWISSLAGVSVLNNKFEVVKQWNKNTAGDNNLTRYRTNSITIYNDTVWIGCYQKGIDLFDLSFKKLAHYTDNDQSGLEDNLVSSFFNDSKGNLWICGDYKLYKYIGGKGKFKSYKLTSGTGGGNPREIAEAKNGNLIIATMSGVIQFNPNSGKYSCIPSDILQKEQDVHSVALNKKGDIWFLTNNHLVHYKPVENRLVLFGKEDGLDVSSGLNELVTFNGTDFYLCQSNKIVKFNCDSLNQPGAPPYLEVNIEANDSNVFWGVRTDKLNLPYNKNKLQFEFTGVSYIKPDQNQYYYQLSGVDKQWNTTYKNAVSYANLSPGEYNFKIKAVNYAGMWSDEKNILFVITPPYWQTWWFRTFAAIFLLTVLYIIIRYISQRNLKEKILQLEKETAVEKERNRIAQDMHDDLGSGLTKIAILSEVVKKKLKQPEAASVQLERISDSSRTLVDNLQDIIWMLNTKHDQLDSLVIYIREYATKYFEQSDIVVTFEYPAQIDHIKIPEEQRRNFFMAVKEALNNIAKHSEATRVNIAFTIHKNIVNFVVSDNGKGFNPGEIRKFANGLKSMKSRMEQAGGKCNLSSEAGKGTTIEFSMCM